jgi:multidrug efflux pump
LRNRLPTITGRGDIVGSVQARDVTARIDPGLDPIRADLPEDYHIEVGGAVEGSRKGQQSVVAVVPVMVMVIVVVTLLMIQLQSVSRTLLVLLTAPLGLIGVTALPARLPRTVRIRRHAGSDRARRDDHA